MTNNIQVVTFIISVVSLLLSLFLAWSLYSLYKLKKTFFAGSNGADLEDAIKAIIQRIGQLDDEQMVAQQRIQALAQQLQFAVQKVGLVRFNPFGDSSGNLSFTLALLDAQDSGVVITSMFGREQNRVYTKKIIKGNSESMLTEEEKAAISAAAA